jgi:hypothetical protein
MANTTNFNWETPDDTDLVKDGALAIRTLGSAIDTSLVDLKGGTTGQVLAKASGTDMDFTWATDASGIPATILDAKGDLIAASGADTAARLAVGANDTVLTADSSTATGLKWAAPAGGGKVLQVKSVTKTDTFTSTSTSYVDITGLTIDITPSSATSKILVMYNVSGSQQVNVNIAHSRLMRNSTAINIGDASGSRDASTSDPMSMDTLIVGTTIAGTFLDSPATTSSTTYKFQVRTVGNTVYINRTQEDNDSAVRARTVSTITVMEIGA